MISISTMCYYNYFICFSIFELWRRGFDFSNSCQSKVLIIKTLSQNTLYFIFDSSINDKLLIIYSLIHGDSIIALARSPTLCSMRFLSFLNHSIKRRQSSRYRSPPWFISLPIPKLDSQRHNDLEYKAKHTIKQSKINKNITSLTPSITQITITIISIQHTFSTELEHRY